MKFKLIRPEGVKPGFVPRPGSKEDMRKLLYALLALRDSVFLRNPKGEIVTKPKSRLITKEAELDSGWAAWVLFWAVSAFKTAGINTLVFGF
jgi:hypothetical protein